MNNKNLKKKKINKKDLTVEERHFGVILEDIDSKLDLVVKGHQSLDKKIDKNHLEFQEFRNEVNYKFKVVTETLNSHTEMIGSMKMDIEIIKQDIEFIKHGLRKKVDLEEFAVLEKRVSLLEKRQ
ncbi:hypothetical protein HZB04_02305 [Candidatus Wolfebacteria bacterium]|nr:hypothetical protein [Candidatus Wolfebacteria bacterium]